MLQSETKTVISQNFSAAKSVPLIKLKNLPVKIHYWAVIFALVEMSKRKSVEANREFQDYWTNFLLNASRTHYAWFVVRLFLT